MSDNPFKKTNRTHVFINMDGKSPLDGEESDALALKVQEFIEERIHKKTGGAGSSHVWVRTSGQ